MRDSLVSILVLVLVGCATSDGPVGPWSRVPPDSPSESGSSNEFAMLRARFCIPRVSEIGFPIFPGAEVAWIEWSKRGPDCDAAAQSSDRGLDLIMMTTAPEEEVEQWFVPRLKGFRQFPAQLSGSNGHGVIFVKDAPPDFSYERDILKLPVPSVVIESTLDPFRKIGYQTVISFRR